MAYLDRQYEHGATRNNIRSIAGVVIKALMSLAEQDRLGEPPIYDIIDADEREPARREPTTGWEVDPAQAAEDLAEIDAALAERFPEIYGGDDDGA